MAITVEIPGALRQFAGNASNLELTGGTVEEVMGALCRAHPALREHLYTPEGRLRSFVNLYVNDRDIRYAEQVATPLRSGDTLSIIPAIAGG